MPVRLSLDVDVAGPGLDGLDQNLVDQPDDRGLLGRLGGFGAVPLQFFQISIRLSCCSRIAIKSSIVSAPTPRCLDQAGQFVGQGNDRHDAFPHRRADRVQRVQIEGIAGRHDQRALAVLQRKHAVAMDQPKRKTPQHAGINGRRSRGRRIPFPASADGTHQVFGRSVLQLERQRVQATIGRQALTHHVHFERTQTCPSFEGRRSNHRSVNLRSLGGEVRLKCRFLLLQTRTFGIRSRFAISLHA